MYRRLLSEASLYSVSTVLARGLSLITAPILTRLLSAGDYGALDLLSYFAVLVPLVAGAALDQGLGRFYASTTDEGERKRMASTVLLYTLLVYLPFVPIAEPLAEQIARGMLSGQVGPGTVLLAFANIWTTALIYIASNQLKYLFRARHAALCQVGAVVVSTVLVLYFVVGRQLGVAGVFLGQGIAQLCFGAVAVYLARDSYCWCFDRRMLVRLMKYSLPLVPGTLAVYAAQYVDRYALNAYRGLADVGIYGMGARVATLVNLFLTGFQGAWMPRVMESYGRDESHAQFATVLRFYTFVTAALVLGLSVFGHEILTVLTAGEFRRGYVVIPLLVMATVLASIANYFTFGIQIAEKSHYRLILNVGALASCVLLNLLLVPRFGIMGAASASALSFLALAVVATSISQRFYRIPYPWIRIVAALAVAFGVAQATVFVGPELGIATFLAKLLVVAASLAILAWTLRIRLDRMLWRAVARMIERGRR